MSTEYWSFYSPGLFSWEWIETIGMERSDDAEFILPAYLVGSGLKPLNNWR